MSVGLRASLITVCVMTLVYSALAPFVYFRHDDWLMLGNTLFISSQNLSFIWEPFWYTSPEIREVWFFRPLFKIIIWLGFVLFKFKIYFWILTHWIFILGSAFLAEKTLMRLKINNYDPYLFFLCFLASVSLHFANVVWVGEGMMNTPQLFFLSLTTFFFVSNSRLVQFLSLLPFFVSLGFKESSAFLPLLLASITWTEGLFKKNIVPLALHFFVMAFYLVYRLGYLPFNPGYKPVLEAQALFEPGAYFFVIILFPFIFLLIQALASRKYSTHSIKTLALFVLFLICLIAPHLGHPFFSPGWVLLPGFYTIWIICYFFPVKLSASQKVWNLLFILITSASIVGFQTWNLKWFKWGKIQRSVHHFIQETDPQLVTHLTIRNCKQLPHHGITFDRVVGAKENLEFVWLLEHQKKVDVSFVPCDFKEDSSESHAIVTWNFPDVEFN